jgi:serine/arginine repetitive matrix protein 2
MPASGQAISEFLAQSAMKFGSLEQSKLPKAHRRKSSLSEARASLSPYGHLLARPPIHGGTTAHVFSRPPVKLQVATEGQPQKKRVSLITKFERTNSAASSHFPSDDEPVSQPSSAIFAQFTRETPPTPPPVLMELPSMSPFKLNLSTGYSPVKKPLDKEKEKRSRVDSEVRRQALGWGKRRNSDGPAKVIAAEPPVPRIPLAFIRPRTVLGDKENIRPYVVAYADRF